MNAGMIIRRSALRLGLAGATVTSAGAVPDGARADALAPVAVWKDPDRGCCDGWIHHMRDAGFNVTVRDTADKAAIKLARHVPDALRSCHTAVIGGYVIEGHVPAEDVKRLIAERPAADGLAAPGMPLSAPGMDQPGEPYDVVMFGAAGGDQLYARH